MQQKMNNRSDLMDYEILDAYQVKNQQPVQVDQYLGTEKFFEAKVYMEQFVGVFVNSICQ